jgi:1,4-alpha-glucan branching enzyme
VTVAPDPARGELAIVLHTHMPYVEGFGTWPFGEEWLWEAIATSYLPLLDVLGRAAGAITLSVTPVLADQLAAPGIADRFRAFLSDVREATHDLDVEGTRDSGAHELVAELEHSREDYRRALARLDAIGGDVLGALAPHVSWTSSATHAVLPLLATDAGARLQVQSGIASHRERFPDWEGGFWLPECAHASWIDGVLEEAGVHATCVDLTDVLGLGAAEQLRPLRSAAGPLLVPIDRTTIELAWSDDGYPASAAYRDYHHRTVHDHRPWAVDGSPYDRERAAALARAHAADFVMQTLKRLDAAREALGAPCLSVCALDTELLGHWWFEGVSWLDAVLDEAAEQGLAISGLDDALTRQAPVDAPHLPVTTWGTPRDLSTWEGPGVADLAWRARRAELDVVAVGPKAGPRALRELIALQSSDWAFMHSRELAGPYARERADGHAEALAQALAVASSAPELRNLAPSLDAAAILSP